MTEQDWARERRKQARHEKLGTNEPRCGLCGEDHWNCFEAHHPAGRKFDPATVRLCMNCHRKVSVDQYDHPAPIAESDPALFAIGRFLLGLADMLRIVVERLVAFGRELTEWRQINAECGR